MYSAIPVVSSSAGGNFASFQAKLVCIKIEIFPYFEKAYSNLGSYKTYLPAPLFSGQYLIVKSIYKFLLRPTYINKKHSSKYTVE